MSDGTPNQAAKVTIDRLALDLPGLTPDAAGRLAQLVAAHLARTGVSAGDVAIPHLSIQLPPTQTLDQIALRIAQAIRQQAV
jgi:hypothetical protein